MQQEVEVKATEILHFGACDSATYPMAKKKHGMEFLREKAHLRPRTNTIGAVARIRNQLAYATHTFFQSHGFLYVHTPIITASDCEGAGEMFQARPRSPRCVRLCHSHTPDHGAARPRHSTVAAFANTGQSRRCP